MEANAGAYEFDYKQNDAVHLAYERLLLMLWVKTWGVVHVHRYKSTAYWGV